MPPYIPSLDALAFDNETLVVVKWRVLRVQGYGAINAQHNRVLFLHTWIITQLALDNRPSKLARPSTCSHARELTHTTLGQHVR